jgi:ribosomal protein S18 acetylase RimI-like enzyme
MTLDWTRVAPASWPALAPLFHAWNRRTDGSARCLHADQGDDLAAYRAELAALQAQGAAFWLCRDRGDPLGVIGCEVDSAARRAWLRGPLASTPALLEAMNAPSMVSFLETALPQVRQWDGIPAADDEPLNAWYAAAGFAPQQLHRVLQATAAGLAAHAPDAGVRVATVQDAVAAWTLHHALFPSSYLSADEFRDGTPQRTLFVRVAAGGDVAGYLHGEDRPLCSEWYVDYLGVAEVQRGRGVATALLQRAGQCAADRGRAHVTLTVREDRPSAIGLYARCGFIELSAGRHWQRTLA